MLTRTIGRYLSRPVDLLAALLATSTLGFGGAALAQPTDDNQGRAPTAKTTTASGFESVTVTARNGIVEQSRRHAFLSHLLGIPHMVVCVNKMDLVDWDRDRFEEIQEEFMAFATRLDVRDVAFIPVSALHGDNVVER